MGFFSELKRRNIYRIAIAYAVLAWLVIEVTGTVAPALGLREWTLQLVVWMGVIGFPVTTVLSWRYELTPEGLKRDHDQNREKPHAYSVHRINAIITLLLCLVLAFIVTEKYVHDYFQSDSAQQTGTDDVAPRIGN